MSVFSKQLQVLLLCIAVFCSCRVANADLTLEAIGTFANGDGVFVNSPAMQEGSIPNSYFSVEIAAGTADSDSSPTKALYSAAMGNFVLRHGDARLEGSGGTILMNNDTTVDQIVFSPNISSLNIASFSPGFSANSVTGIQLTFNLFGGDQFLVGDPTVSQLAGFNGLALTSSNVFNRASRIDFNNDLSLVGRSSFQSVTTVDAVPESSELAVLGFTALGLLMTRRNRKRF